MVEVDDESQDSQILKAGIGRTPRLPSVSTLEDAGSENSRVHIGRRGGVQRAFSCDWVRYQTREYLIASGGVALPNGWKLLFGEAIRADSPPRAAQSQEEPGFVSKTEQNWVKGYACREGAPHSSWRRLGRLSVLACGGARHEGRICP